MSSGRVRVGIIGCGEVTQVVHLPNLVFLSEKFHVTYLCDVSPGALQLCSSRLPHPHKTTSDPNELCTASDVDVVFVLNSDEYHAEHSRLALFSGKHVFVEKPVALSCSAVNSIIDAEAETGNKVMVGYMRRYASAFEDAMKEIGGAGEILYAKVRGKDSSSRGFVLC
jgi:predicted dehydrogenase